MKAAVIVDRPSPNFGPRKDNARPSLIVIHYTAMESCDAAAERLCDPVPEVSAHYLIGMDGTVIRLVDEAMRAWHAGAGAWGQITDVNSHSIGIELDNAGDHPFSEPQMRALEALLPQIMERWGIGPAGVVGHSDTAVGRKIDPGLRFDWRRLARQGLAVWPTGEGQGDFYANAHIFGYRGDEAEVLRAFRMRFRPYATGALDACDCAMMGALVAGA